VRICEVTKSFGVASVHESVHELSLQCFDSVGWVTGRPACKKSRDSNPQGFFFGKPKGYWPGVIYEK